jgi:hypothetical protein
VSDADQEERRRCFQRQRRPHTYFRRFDEEVGDVGVCGVLGDAGQGAGFGIGLRL